jgi:hypothetical protein
MPVRVAPRQRYYSPDLPLAGYCISGSLGIAVIKTFWTRISRTTRIFTDFFRAFSVRLRAIRVICVQNHGNSQRAAFQKCAGGRVGGGFQQIFARILNLRRRIETTEAIRFPEPWPRYALRSTSGLLDHHLNRKCQMTTCFTGNAIPSPHGPTARGSRDARY